MQMNLKSGEVKRLECLTAVGPVRFLFSYNWIPLGSGPLHCVCRIGFRVERHTANWLQWASKEQRWRLLFFREIKCQTHIAGCWWTRTQPNLDRPLKLERTLAPRPSPFALFSRSSVYFTCCFRLYLYWCYASLAFYCLGLQAMLKSSRTCGRWVVGGGQSWPCWHRLRLLVLAADSTSGPKFNFRRILFWFQFNFLSV